MLCATAIFYHFIICRKCGLNILAMFNLNTEKGHDAVNLSLVLTTLSNTEHF